MNLVDRNSALWGYLTDDIKGLMVDGELLVDNAKNIPRQVSDYSYLVFPFAKGYEGFLKKLFLDLKMIKEDEYYGDEIRIGRILNPTYNKKAKSVFYKIRVSDRGDEKLAQELWEMWHDGRNQVFHYFPHNFRKLSYKEAIDIINSIILAMQSAVENFIFEAE